MKTYHVAYTKDGYGGTQYTYADITAKGLITLRKRLIAEGLPKNGNCFIIFEDWYRLIGTLTNRQPAYPGIWLWSGSGGWRAVNPTGSLGAEVFDHNYRDMKAKMEKKSR